MSTFKVFSSHGEITVNADTGQVVEVEVYEGGDPFPAISKFDIDEYKQYHKVQMVADEGIDILDIGYWLQDMQYSPPDQEWRKLMDEDQALT